MHAFISDFHNKRFTASRKQFQEHSRLMFSHKFVHDFLLLDETLYKTIWLGARDFYCVIVQRSVHNKKDKQKDINLHLTELTLLYQKLKSYNQTHDSKQTWFHRESSRFSRKDPVFQTRCFYPQILFGILERLLSAASHFSWSSRQNHRKIASQEFAY